MAMNIMAAVIVQVLTQLLAVGVNRIHLMLAKKQQVSVKDVFWAYRNRPDRFILGTMLRFVICLLPAVPAVIGAACLVEIKSVYSYVSAGILLAGLAATELYLAYTFELIYFIYIENPQITVLEGFRISHAVMLGIKRNYFV